MVLTCLSLSEDDGGPVQAVGLGCGVRAVVVLPPDELPEEPPELVGRTVAARPDPQPRRPPRRPEPGR